MASREDAEELPITPDGDSYCPLLEMLTEDCLIEILEYVSSQDLFALIQVNRQLRAIVLDYLCPRAVFKLHKLFTAYPVKEYYRIYELIFERARKMEVDGWGATTWKIFEELECPNLKSLSVVGTNLKSVNRVPAELQVLHLECYLSDFEVNFLLKRVAPTVEDLRLHPIRFNVMTLPPMPNLRKLNVKMHLSSLEGVLRQSPNLVDLNATIYDQVDFNLPNLIEAFKSTPHLTVLRISLFLWSDRGFDFPAPIDPDPILPRLKELYISHNIKERFFIRDFLRNIGNGELKKFRGNLTSPSLEDLLIQCPNLESLHVKIESSADGEAVNNLMEAFQCSSRLTIACLDVEKWRVRISPEAVTIPILPALKELEIYHNFHRDQEKFVCLFLRNIYNIELRRLSLANFCDQIGRFDGLESLQMNILPDTLIIINILRRLDRLVELRGCGFVVCLWCLEWRRQRSLTQGRWSERFSMWY